MPSGAANSPAQVAVNLQAIGIEERKVLYEMAQRFWEELMPHAPVVRDPSVRPAYFSHEFRLGEPGHLAWWIVLDSERAGFAHLELNEDWAGRPWAYIKGFYVEPKWRRQGFGRAAAVAVAGLLCERGVQRIDLHARSDTPAALAFWRAIGYNLASYRMRQYLG
jgi:ribosomal protein S18 acetylase RimI-like enzyme